MPSNNTLSFNLEQTPPLFGLLGTQGWFIKEGLFGMEVCEYYGVAIEQWQKEQRFRPAQIGKGQESTRRPEIRSDYIYWPEEGAAQGPAQKALAQLNEFRLQLNREIFLGAGEVEAHFSLYPPGSGYKKHLDVFRQDQNRLVSFILYLNCDWPQTWGGELLLYSKDDENQRLATIPPQGGSFACFLSGSIPHEVQPVSLKAQRPRLALTGWLKKSSPLPSPTFPVP